MNFSTFDRDQAIISSAKEQIVPAKKGLKEAENGFANYKQYSIN